MALIDNCIAYYKLDATSGNVVDELGNNHGTNVGATRGATGKINNAFDFEESESDYVSDVYVIPYGSFSISAWFKVESVTGAPRIYVNRQIASGNPIIYILLSGNNILLRLRDNTGAGLTDVTLSGINTGTWYHVVATYDSSNDAMKLYLNAGAPDTNTYAGGTWSNINRGTIGAENYPSYEQFFDGVIDLVGVWDRALSSSEVSELYNSGNAFDYPFSVGFTRKIKISGTFQDKPIKTKVAGTFEDKPIKIKVGGTFQDA